jgi:hypothetical protein
MRLNYKLWLSLTEKMQLPLKKLRNRLRHILLETILNAPFGTRHFFGIPRRYPHGAAALRAKNAIAFFGLTAFIFIVSFFALANAGAAEQRINTKNTAVPAMPSRASNNEPGGGSAPSTGQNLSSPSKATVPAPTASSQTTLTSGTRVAVEIGHDWRIERPPQHGYLPEQLQGYGGKHYVYVDIGENGERSLSTNRGVLPQGTVLHLTQETDRRNTVLIDVSRPDIKRVITRESEPYFNHYRGAERSGEKVVSYAGVQEISVDTLIKDIAPGLVIRSSAAGSSGSPPAPAAAGGAKSTVASGARSVATSGASSAAKGGSTSLSASAGASQAKSVAKAPQMEHKGSKGITLYSGRIEPWSDAKENLLPDQNKIMQIIAAAPGQIAGMEKNQILTYAGFVFNDKPISEAFFVRRDGEYCLRDVYKVEGDNLLKENGIKNKQRNYETTQKSITLKDREHYYAERFYAVNPKYQAKYGSERISPAYQISKQNLIDALRAHGITVNFEP